MGVFMSVFLVGGLWYMMGIGQAVVYRQSVQAGADATALTSAVYHARGMNVLAMVNIVMGAVMAIAAAAAMLMQIAAMVISVATTLCDMSKMPEVTNADGSTTNYSYLDFACEDIDAAKDLMVKMEAVIVAVKSDTDSMLLNLSVAQKSVALTAPWLGSSQGMVAAAWYAPYVVSGGAGSPAMVPQGERYGLPVQDEPFAEACNRGKVIVGKLVELLVPATLTQILEFMDVKVVGMMPIGMCEGGNGGYNQQELFKQDDVCHPPPYDSPYHKHKERCEKCMADLEDEEEPVEEVDLTALIDPDDKSTKGVFVDARNGNDYMQVYGVVRGAPSMLQQSDGGVEAPAWGGAALAAPDTLNEDLGIAQAEFYYDQTLAAIATDSNWGTSPNLSWDSYKENTLWNLRWRARLRRFRVPTAVDVNVMSTGIQPTAAGYTEGLGTFNGGASTAAGMLSGSAVADKIGGNAAAFIGSGPALIH
jgi:hypothetical protein